VGFRFHHHTNGTGDIMTLTDSAPPPTQAFYRIDASQREYQVP